MDAASRIEKARRRIEAHFKTAQHTPHLFEISTQVLLVNRTTEPNTFASQLEWANADSTGALGIAVPALSHHAPSPM